MDVAHRPSPDVSGVDVYAQIALRWPALPVIFATGHADMSRLHDLTSKPHVGYLLKPYQFDDLVNMLNAVLQDVPRRPAGNAAGRVLPFASSELPVVLGAELG